MKESTRKYFEKKLEIIRERKRMFIQEHKFEEAVHERDLEKEILQIMDKDPLEE